MADTPTVLANQGDRPVNLHFLTTKLYIPRPRTTLVSRPRLHVQLIAALRSPLTLVAAPAGFGKTTLLAAWAEQPRETRPPIAWVSLDAGDNDPVRFWTYVILALDKLYTGIAARTLPLLQSPQPSALEALLTVVLNEVAALPSEGALVLDDYHVIEAPPIHDVLTFLLDHAPPTLHLVLATRSDPPLPLARWRARGQLAEVRAADLRFTTDEAAIFLREGMGLQISAPDLAVLDARTEGWIAGLHLAALSMQGREDVQGFIAAFTGSHRHIVDYLAAEVLQQQPDEVQRFLLRTSILDRLCSGLCDEVTGGWGSDSRSPIPNPRPPAGQTMLEALERANLFLIPLDEERRWYRYHHLFAEVLRYHLRQTYPELIAELHRRAAVWLEHNGLVVEAVSHALAGEDFAQAARLVEQHAEAMWQRGEQATLEGWLQALPAEVVRSRPRLCILHAWMLFLTGQLQAVEPRLQDAEGALRDAELSRRDIGSVERSVAEAKQELLGMVAAIRSAYACIQHDAHRTIAMAREALDLLPEHAAHWRATTNITLGIGLDSTDDVAGALPAFVDAAAISQAAGDPFVAMVALWNLGYRQMMQGRLREAERTYRQALQFVQERGEAHLPATGYILFGLGDLLREWNDLEAAERHLRAGIELGRQGGNFDTLMACHMFLARVLEARGALDAADDALREAEELVRRSPTLPRRVWVAAMRVRLWLAQGNLPDATRWAEEYASGADKERMAFALAYVRDFASLTLARVYIAQGSTRAQQALQLLEPLLHAAEAAGRTGIEIEGLILKALALQAQRDTALALVALEQALALAEPEGYVRIFLDEGTPMAVLLAQGLGVRYWGLGTMDQQQAVRAYAEKLLATIPRPDVGEPTPQHAARDQSPDALTPNLQPPTPRIELLTGREREVLRLLAAGMSQPEIARQLIVSINTVKTQIKSIYGKLDVHSRDEAVAKARARRLLA